AMLHAHHVASQPYGILLTLLFTGGLYLRGWLRVRSWYKNRIPAWRAVSLLLGLFLIWLAVASPMADAAHELLTGHMVQHLLLMTFAAPLIWLGEPLIALLQGMPKNVHEGLAPLRWRPAQVLGSAIIHPAVCWLGAAGALIGWHIPQLFALGMKSPVWHAMMEASFLVTGLLFWWPVFDPWPSQRNRGWLIIVYLFLATLPCDILSGFLVFCDRVVYPGYVDSSQPFGLSPLQDQQLAGALMWTAVTVIYFIIGGSISVQLLSPQRSQENWISQQPAFDSAAPLAAGQRIEVV
ncbi:MAG TPA: cytochrome c oxidase assembly protein, partial [Terriglobales bacterium]|nr:cytochrome c oxidase assembly protein [Terriglobales bacterium]